MAPALSVLALESQSQQQLLKDFKASLWSAYAAHTMPACCHLSACP